MTKEARTYNGVKTVYSINGISKIYIEPQTAPIVTDFFVERRTK